MPRHTADIVALMLAFVVVVVTILTAISILYIQITNPSQDVSRGADAIGRIISVITAALVGYMAGRRITS